MVKIQDEFCGPLGIENVKHDDMDHVAEYHADIWWYDYLENWQMKDYLERTN